MLSTLAVGASALQVPSVKLAGTGDTMPGIGYGTWLSQPGEVYTGVFEALKGGYKHIDAAWVYMNEKEVGKAIAESISGGVVSREDLWVTSKLWNNYHRPNGESSVRAGCMDSLAKLGLDYLDLYLIHFPVSFIPGCSEASRADQMENPQIPLADTWAAMEALVDEGLVRNIGVSNFEIEHLKEVQAVATKPIAVNQFETHPYYQRNELMSYCSEHGIAVTAHSSMGGAANVMAKFHASPPLREDQTVREISEKHGQTPSATLLRWALQRPTVIIPKSVTPSRIAENLAVARSFELDSDDMARLAKLDKPGLEGCYCHPVTPWLGRSEFTGSTASYYG
jgi:alcohol dehydrogenase (NADP+)